MSTLIKRVDALEVATGDMSPEVVHALRKLLGVPGPVEPGWLSKVTTADLVRAQSMLNARKEEA